MQTAPLRFRDATPDDAEAITELMNSACSGPDAATALSLPTALIAHCGRRGFRPTGRPEPFPHDAQPGALRQDFDLIELA